KAGKRSKTDSVLCKKKSKGLSSVVLTPLNFGDKNDADDKTEPTTDADKAAYCSNGRIGVFSCLLCNFTTTTRKYLNRHLRRHGKTEKLTCPTCNYVCTNAIKMKKHLEGHVGLHSCLLCPYATVHKENLAVHMAVHKQRNGEGKLDQLVGDEEGGKHSTVSLEVVYPGPNEDGFDSDVSEPAQVTISKVDPKNPELTSDTPAAAVAAGCGETTSIEDAVNQSEGFDQLDGTSNNLNLGPLNPLINPNFASLVQFLLGNKTVLQQHTSSTTEIKQESREENPSHNPDLNLLPGDNASQLPLYTQLSVLANMSVIKNNFPAASRPASTQPPPTPMADQGEEVIYSCTECSYSTNRKDHLLRHHNQHTGKGMQYCPHCPYSTVRKEHMKRHVKLHTEGVLQCEQCAFKTRRKEQFRLHMQSHEAGDHLKCPHCSYITLRKEHLKRHLHRHILDRAAKCQYCHYTTDRRDRMQKHVDNLHSHIGEVEDVFRWGMGSWVHGVMGSLGDEFMGSWGDKFMGVME
ncbi:Zinc finger C2H2-type, partial [Trinorchestia longiramus]